MFFTEDFVHPQYVSTPPQNPGPFGTFKRRVRTNPTIAKLRVAPCFRGLTPKERLFVVGSWATPTSTEKRDVLGNVQD